MARPTYSSFEGNVNYLVQLGHERNAQLVGDVGSGIAERLSLTYAARRPPGRTGR
jgi:hypothetical protein